MPPAIRVENLSKRYRIARSNQRSDYRTLRESLVSLASAPLRRWFGGGEGAQTQEFWALREIDFAVQPGEVLGIIGRNGAGKSTLLKVLSRITEPTSGRVRTRGRVGSLLEVGTGFHPELTGRENIFMNGSILGMSRREIERRFDDIVAFAEIEQFLDTPVKRYSSGMYVRLAFSVAAALEPEILLVDEVLAVGDATYQRRCIDRMSELTRSGMTILFVSHNMDLIPRFCQRAISLANGAIVDDGDAKDTVERYLATQFERAVASDISQKPRDGDGRATFTKIHLVDSEGHPRINHPSGEDLIFDIKIESKCAIADAAIAVIIKSLSGTRILTSWTRELGASVSLRKGLQRFRCCFRGVRLRPGHSFSVGLWMESGSAVIDCVDDALTFEAVDGLHTDTYSKDRHQGLVLYNYEWTQVV